jgi:SLOG cluster2
VPQVQQRAKPLAGLLVGLSAGDSQDVRAYGLLPRHLDIVFGAVVTALVLRGARLAYGGDLRQRGFTQQLYENVAEAYADEYFMGEPDGAPPFVHYLAAHTWANLPPQELAAWLQSSAGLAEVRFMSGERYMVVQPQDQDFLVEAGPEAAGVIAPMVFTAAEFLPRLRGMLTPEDLMPAESLVRMRRAIARDCDVRILLGGKMYGYAGNEPGIGAEARESLAQGKAVLPLGGFGGAARDVARQLGLMPADARRREVATGPGYPEVMEQLAEQRTRASGLLGNTFPRARILAMTTETKEAARLVVEILQGLPAT